MRTFSINGRLYKAVPFTFNTVVDLEEMGVRMEDAGKKPMSLIRAYFALCCGGDQEYAGNELQAHMIAGGKLDDLSRALGDEMQDSDFFRHLGTLSNVESEDEEAQPKKTVKKLK